MSTATAPTLYLIGDGITGRWITWHWSHQPGAYVAELPDYRDLLTRLRAALPQHPVACLADLRFDADLADPVEEHALMSELGAALIPESLRRDIMANWRRWGTLHIRLAPAPTTAIVPWHLLCLEEDIRLLDVADVSFVGPLLPRDIYYDTPRPHTAQETDRPLYIVDPLPADPSILPTLTLQEARQWRDRLACQPHTFVQQTFTRDDLSVQLHQQPTRMMYLGHCMAAASSADTGMLLSDGRSTSSVSGAIGHRDAKSLTGSDLLIGGPTPTDSPQGYQRWPMPPRVAVIACASGVDLFEHEPFGLATAILANGAELVHATLWPVPTDTAFARLGSETAGFTQLALTVDAAQQTPSPIAAVCQWQRQQLAAWRDNPSVATAPLWWAPLIAFAAPQRHLDYKK